MPFYRAHINQDAYITHEYVIEADDKLEAARAGRDQWKGRRDDIILVQQGAGDGFDDCDACDTSEVEELTEAEYNELLAEHCKPKPDPNSAMKRILELVDGDRRTVNNENIWDIWTALNKTLIEIREIAKAEIL